jgi:outer membrane protein OmpA-like peptidoglycan-associated protein
MVGAGERGDGPGRDRDDRGGADRPDDITSLRALIVGPEQRRLSVLQARLDDKEGRAADLAEVLPRVLLRHAQDPRFTTALTAPIQKAITTSVRRNPKPLADALFPVMGPAIRKAVAASLAGMVDSLNRTLEHSLSIKSLQWRLEGWRTGKSFAEVVLSKTLLYRVEQIFLIHRESGLLLSHAWADSVDVRDADMVSGMLTAIRDFAQDSFKVAKTESLDAFSVGDLSVWIEAGPRALVAAVIRGPAPAEFRARLQETVESIHLQFGEVLDSFSGDTAQLADARHSLEACLYTEYRSEAKRPGTRGAWIVVALGVLAMAVWGGVRWQSASRWDGYLSALRAEPGIVVLSAERDWGQFVVSGLRDPLARDPQTLLPAAGLSPDDVRAAWTPYFALAPALVVTRATSLLRPPPGVVLTITDGVLSAAGDAPVDWVAEARRTAPFVAGVASFDAAGALSAQTRQSIAAIEGQTLLFLRGRAALLPDQEPALSALVASVRTLDRIAAASSQTFRVDIVGHTDADGADEANLPLSQARADVVRAAIDPDTAHLQIVSHGESSRRPVVVGDNELDKQRNRRVTITVTRADPRAAKR